MSFLLDRSCELTILVRLSWDFFGKQPTQMNARGDYACVPWSLYARHALLSQKEEHPGQVIMPSICHCLLGIDSGGMGLSFCVDVDAGSGAVCFAVAVMLIGDHAI